MTAEIAILNRTAVALATDSAVTIGRGENAKTYLSENKLFELSETKPIGLMIYNSLDFYGIPWEVLVKDFRAERGTAQCDMVLNWTTCFVDWLKEKRLPATQQQDQHLPRYINEILAPLQQQFRARIIEIQANRKRRTRATRLKEADAVIPTLVATHKRRLAGVKPAEKFATKEEMLEYLNSKDDILRKVEAAIFEPFPLYDTDREVLKDFYAEYLSRDMFTSFCTGFVFAGFGDREMFPSLQHNVLDGVFGDRIRWFERDYYDVDKIARGRSLPSRSLTLRTGFYLA